MIIGQKFTKYITSTLEAFKLLSSIFGKMWDFQLVLHSNTVKEESVWIFILYGGVLVSHWWEIHSVISLNPYLLFFLVLPFIRCVPKKYWISEFSDTYWPVHLLASFVTSTFRKKFSKEFGKGVTLRSIQRERNTYSTASFISPP